MKKNSTLITLLLFLISCISARAQWEQTSTPPNGSIWTMVTVGNNLVAGASNGGVYVSSDDGATWTQRNGNFQSMVVSAIVTNGTDIFVGAGTSGQHMVEPGIYKSSDLGITWTDVTPSDWFGSYLIFNPVIALDGTDIYVTGDYYLDGLGGRSFYKSSTTGLNSSSWTHFNTGLPSLAQVLIRSLKVHGTKIYAGTYGQGVWVSPTSSPNWSVTSGMESYADYIQTIFFNGNTALAGNISGDPVLYRSADNGMNWSQSSTSVFDNKPVYAIINDQDALYAGTEKNGVMKSTDNGITWTTFNEGFKDASGDWFCNHINIRSFTLKGNTLFAGTDCGVWKRTLPARPATPPGTPNTGSDSLVNIYPNPNTSNTLTLRVRTEDLGSMCIIKDATGSIVLQKRITNETTLIDISSLSGGFYFVHVGTLKRSIKLIKR